MLRTFQSICILLTAVVVFSACKKDDKPVDFGYDYYPLQKGQYVTYSVEEIIIDDLQGIDDTLHYYIKTKIGDTLTDNQGRVARRFERYYRNDPGQPWVLKDIWTTVIDGGRAELTEENQRVIKLVFAPGKYKEWNANAYNVNSKLDCYYRDIHLPSSINGIHFDSTVTVEQQDDSSAVDYRRKFEQYAKGVGLFYKHYKDLRIVGGDTLNVTKGTEIYMRLTGYGIE